jgi:hypothetical protein
MNIVTALTKLAEIQEAIQHLPPYEQEALRQWFLETEESPELLAAIDEADRSLAEEGGVPIEEVRKDLSRWISR